MSGFGSKAQGVVLLSVLLILALLTALIYQLMGRHSLVVAQARQTFAGDQALAYVLGGEAFARQVLYEDWSETGQGLDTLQESWAQPLAPFEVDNGFLEIQIRDLNGCFNLNSLLGNNTRTGRGTGEEGEGQPRDGAPPATTQTPPGNSPKQTNLARFKTLLRNQNIPDSVADVWRDWIDADEEIAGFGAEDGEYLLYTEPYRTANQLATHLSELQLLRDIEPEFVAILESVACVLPNDALRLNINTVNAASLAALSPSLSEAQMAGLTESAREYSNVNEVTSEYPDLVPAVDALSVTSDYFEVRVRAQVDESQVEMASVLYRDNESGAIVLVGRDFGKGFRSLYTEEGGSPVGSGSDNSADREG